MLFLVLFGSIYKNTSTAKVTVVEVGNVQLLNQAKAAAPKQLGQVLTITRTGNLSAALEPGTQGQLSTPPCSSRARP